MKLKLRSKPSFFRSSLLLAGALCLGAGPAYSAGTQTWTSAYATLQPNATNTAFVYTVSWVATDTWFTVTPGIPARITLSPYGNGSAELDDVTLNGYGGAYLFDNTTNGGSATTEIQYFNDGVEPNASTQILWEDPQNYTLGHVAPATSTAKWDDLGNFTDFGDLTYGSGIQGVTGVFSPNPDGSGPTGPAGIYTDEDGGVAGTIDDLGILLSGVTTLTTPNKGYVQVVVPYPTQLETATVGAGVAQVETLTLSGAATAARAQVETATVVAPSNITTAGNVSVTVTGTLITGSPLVVTTANVALNATATTVATAIRTAMNAAGLSGAITNNYTVGGTGANVILTKKSAFTPNDGTLNIAIANGTCAGITAAPTSANTTSGIGVGQTGTLNIVVTAAGMTNSSKTVPVTITAGNTTAQQTVLAVTALNADPDVSAFFTASGTTTVILTAKLAASNDATMNVASSPGDIIGSVAVAASANTTAGYAIGAGDAAITVTGADIVGSPLAVNVALLASDTSGAVATKIRAALSALPAITNFHTVGGTGAQVTLTKSVAPLNVWDATLNVAIADGTTTGVTANPTSVGADGFTDRFFPGTYTDNGAIELVVTSNASYTPKLAVSSDFDSDLDIDNADLGLIAGNFTGSGGTGKFYRTGDTNGDGDVDNADLGVAVGGFTGALASGTVGEIATLTYNATTGNVTLDGYFITSFQLENSAGTFVTGNFNSLTGGTFGGTFQDVSPHVLADSDLTFGGLSGDIDLGNVFPVGLDLAGLDSYLTTSVFTGLLGSGQQEFDLIVTSGPGGSDFATWIGGYNVGGLTALNDDADGDGIENGVENYFGTAPDAVSTGLVVATAQNGTLTFSHPLNPNPATGLTATYRWSKDLEVFTADGRSFDGTTVDFVQGIPTAGMVTVTATVSGVATGKLFVVIEVTED